MADIWLGRIVGHGRLLGMYLEELDVIGLACSCNKLRHILSVRDEDNGQLQLRLHKLVARPSSLSSLQNVIQKLHLGSLCDLQVRGPYTILQEVAMWVCQTDPCSLERLGLHCTNSEGYATIYDTWVKRLAASIGSIGPSFLFQAST